MASRLRPGIRLVTIAAMLVQQAVNARTLGSLYALIAIGLAITLSIRDGVNFAQGSLVMWGAYLSSASVGLVRSALGRRRHEIARRA